MEIICRIKNELAPVVRGENAKFTIVGYELVSGRDEFYAEMVYQGEVKPQQSSKDFYYVANIRSSTRTYQDKNNLTRYEVRLTLNSLSIL